MKRGRVGFLKPRDDNDDTEPGFQEDRPDLDTNSQTSFIYNPNHHQDLERQKSRLPIAAYKNNLLYLLENYQVSKKKYFLEFRKTKLITFPTLFDLNSLN